MDEQLTRLLSDALERNAHALDRSIEAFDSTVEALEGVREELRLTRLARERADLVTTRLLAILDRLGPSPGRA